jgi:hypothetical protein
LQISLSYLISREITGFFDLIHTIEKTKLRTS